MSDLRQCRGSFCELRNFNDFNPTECSMAAAQPCVHCSELAKLDEEVARAYDLLTTLGEKRQEIKEKINLHHDRLRNIPPEIIATIFTIYVKEANANIERMRLTGAANWSPPFTLAAVCKRWRQVAQKMPVLWTTVNIRIGVQVELVAQWLTHSGRLPLDILLYTDPSFKWYQDEKPLFDVLREYLPRWRSLTTELSPATNMMLLDDLPAASSLQTLQIFPLQNSSHHYQPNDNFFINSQIFYTSLVKTQWGSLTSVVLVGATVKQLFQLLRNAVQLFACSFQATHIDNNDDLRSVRSHPSIIHECLRELKLIDVRLEGLNTVLDKIILPSLDSFLFSSGYRPAVDRLLSFFAASRCSITTLDFTGKMGDKDMIRILEALPTVKYFSINFVNRVEGRITGCIFKRLFNNPSCGHDGFLPHLEGLKVLGEQQFSWPSFLETLQLCWVQQNTQSLLHRHVSVPLKLSIELSIFQEGDLKRVTTVDYIDANTIRQLTSIPNEVLSRDTSAGDYHGWVESIYLSLEHYGDQMAYWPPSSNFLLCVIVYKLHL